MSGSERTEFVQALRDWTHVFMHQSMRGFMAKLKANNLSMSQIGALMHLHHKGAAAPNEISCDLGVTNAAVSQMLDRLVEHGYVDREEDPEDRRSKKIELTGKGRDVVGQTIAARQRWFGDLADLLSEDELTTATAAFRMLSDRAEAVRKEEE